MRLNEIPQPSDLHRYTKDNLKQYRYTNQLTASVGHTTVQNPGNKYCSGPFIQFDCGTQRFIPFDQIYNLQ